MKRLLIISAFICCFAIQNTSAQRSRPSDELYAPRVVDTIIEPVDRGVTNPDPTVILIKDGQVQSTEVASYSDLLGNDSMGDYERLLIIFDSDDYYMPNSYYAYHWNNFYYNPFYLPRYHRFGFYDPYWDYYSWYRPHHYYRPHYSHYYRPVHHHYYHHNYYRPRPSITHRPPKRNVVYRPTSAPSNNKVRQPSTYTKTSSTVRQPSSSVTRTTTSTPSSTSSSSNNRTPNTSSQSSSRGR